MNDPKKFEAKLVRDAMVRMHDLEGDLLGIIEDAERPDDFKRALIAELAATSAYVRSVRGEVERILGWDMVALCYELGGAIQKRVDQKVAASQIAQDALSRAKDGP